ncbi:uncharacterized protein TRUGW13939_00854 [Talaromyces rugulosus]|uniref:Telomere replication protein EST3 n=1 Tax=Talaromyces rugulosus TaxID=121627 RepID=A0A7H8QIG7_TALRU|nr:uncharacterized protein TRUGW13939_00854 [Talaromyces rugulosus]QKX53774.1 hypothetical protein TRUGW13939_00854 [Talaromyces rugulosus]
MTHPKSKRSKGAGQHADASLAHEATINEHNDIDEHKEAREPSPSDSIQSQNPGIMDRSTLDCESQEMLATQFPMQSPPRPFSAHSIQSQGANVEESSISPSKLQDGQEDQEKLSTQALPREPNYSIPNISVFKTAMSDGSNKTMALLQHLRAGKKDAAQEKARLHQIQTPTTTTKRGLTINALLNPEEDPEIPGDIANNEATILVPSILSIPTNPSHRQSGLAQGSPPSQPHPIPPSVHQKRSSVTPEKRPSSAHRDVTDITPIVNDPAISANVTIKTSTTEPIEPARKRDRSESDHPWAGMHKIRRRDVKIPPDQGALFDSGDSWIPPDVGHPTPQGHVPLALLQEWNTRMTRAKEAVESPKSLQSAQEQEVADSPLPSQFVPQSEDESESDPESRASWSASPPDHLRRLAVPPDSSPVGQPRFPVTAGYQRRNQDKDTERYAIDTNGNNGDLERVSQTPRKVHKVNGVQETNDANEDDHTEEKDLPMDDSPIKDDNLERDEQQNMDKDEMSEESDMEISIPLALDASAQEDIASQVESYEIGDSALSNSSLAPISSSAPTDKIQIQNTQSVGVHASTKSGFIQPSTAPQSSSDGNKSSSQVIANSVDSKGKRFIVHENEPGATDDSLVVDSQNTNSDEPHSSIPSHQDSQRILEVVTSSSLFSIGFQTQDYMELDETGNETTQSGSRGSAVVPSAITLKRNAEHFEYDESPLKRVVKRAVTDRNMIRTQQSPISTAIKQKLLDDKYRHTFDVTPDGAPRVFEMFKKSYPAYTGEFLHFKNLCCKLHLLRRVGLLQNYFFWDDFIMRHIGDYGTYVQNCVSAGRHWDDYEDYFCSNFVTKPSFKKRSLVPHTLDAVISESDIRPSSPVMVDMETQVDMDRVTNARISSGKPHMADVAVEATFESQDMMAVDSGTSPGYRNSVQRDEPSQLGSTKRQRTTAKDNSNIFEFSGTLNSEMRGTASLELGGDSSKGNETRHSHKATAALITRMQKEDRHGVRTLIRNKQRPQRFLNELRHDADTPLRTWARAEQNVVSERRRRGGWQVPCDESGNIELEEYPRTGWENGRQTRGWAWRASTDYS